MESYIYWFLLALMLVILEMATGTFYLLMIGIAVSIGGLSSLLGGGFPLQLVSSALAVIAGTIILKRWKSKQINPISATNLDYGQSVKVLSWREDGTARVLYRGAEWDAEPESQNTPHDEILYIKAMRGSTVILTQHKPH